MIGIQVSKQDLNTQAGNAALNLNDNFIKATEMKEFVDGIGGEAGLISLGFTAQEANDMKTALDDLAYMKTQAFDASASVKKLYGMGIK